jgi:L-malate glycosyltransferase
MLKVKVLHIDNSIDYTGGFKALLDYIVSEKDKVTSVVILPKGSKCIIYLEKERIQYYEIPFVEIQKNVWALFIYLPRLFLNAWKIKKIAVKEGIDVMHSNDMYNLCFYLVKYFYNYKRPLLTHLRLMPSAFPAFIYNGWKKIHLRYSDELVAVSYAIKKGYDNSPRIHVVYDVADLIERHAQYKVEYNSALQRPFRFLYLANFTRGKGQELAIEAFRIFALENSDSTLTFAGGLLGKEKNKKFKEELIHTSNQYGLKNKIVFEDFVEDSEFKMKQYDCILNFSSSESFSYTSYDSLRFGIPLIVSDCGGPSELLVSGESGILVENKSIVAMAEAMHKLKNDNIMLNQFSTNSRKNIKKIMNSALKFDYLSNLFLSLKTH